MEVNAILKKKGETIQVKDNFQKREFVVELYDNPKYPQFIEFQLVQENCGILDQFELNSKIKIDYDLRGRIWTKEDGTEKVFNTLQAWKIGNPVDSPTENKDGLPF